MLINCPKCGFTQPDDRYCARCGVDMKTYRPPDPNWFDRILKRPSLLAFLSVVVLLVGYSYIQSRKQQQELEDRANLFRSAGPVIVKSTPEPTSEVATAPTEEMQAKTLPETESSMQPVSMAAPILPETNNAPAPVKKYIISIRYFEMDRNELDRVFDESGRWGAPVQFGGFRAGPVPNSFLNLGRERGATQLHLERIELSAEQNQKKWFVGKEKKESGRIGLSHFLQMDPQVTDGNLRIELETVSHFKNTAEETQPTDRSWPLLPMTLDSDTSWIIQVDLPRGIEQLPGVLLGELGVLKIFRSIDFKSDKSEFTIVVSSVTDKK